MKKDSKLFWIRKIRKGKNDKNFGTRFAKYLRQSNWANDRFLKRLKNNFPFEIRNLWIDVKSWQMTKSERHN